MSLIELKQAARGRGIKYYYYKPQAELIHLLSMPELPFEMKLEKMTIIELREEAKRRGIRGNGIWKSSRRQLVDLLYPRNEAPANKDDENKSDTDEHNDPQQHDAE